MGVLKSSFRKWEPILKFRLKSFLQIWGPSEISKLREWCSHSGSRLHAYDSLQVAKNNNVEIQCGRVLLLIWKMTLLDFFGSKFCKKVWVRFRLLSIFNLVNSLRWTLLVSGKRVCLKEMSVFKRIVQSRVVWRFWSRWLSCQSERPAQGFFI